MNRRVFIKTMGAGAVCLALGGCDFKSPLSTVTLDNTSAVDKNAPDFSGKIEYRSMPRIREKISTIGLGASALHESSASQIEKMIVYASEQGINLIDTVMSQFGPSEAIGRALKGRRDKIMTQMHIGVTYPSQTYTRTRDLKQIQQGFEQQLNGFGTDYSDIGLIHYVDEPEDFEKVISEDVLDYAQKLKRDGIIRYLGFSSHSADIAHRFLETGVIDIFMFSLNPAYDFVPLDAKLKLSEERRREGSARLLLYS